MADRLNTQEAARGGANMVAHTAQNRGEVSRIGKSPIVASGALRGCKSSQAWLVKSMTRGSDKVSVTLSALDPRDETLPVHAGVRLAAGMRCGVYRGSVLCAALAPSSSAAFSSNSRDFAPRK